MYNKLFTKILDSSIWLEPDATRIVWLTCIAAMDEDGFCCFASPANLAHRANVPLEACLTALKTLEGPDVNSSDPANDGKRLERVPGGWMVLNSEKYRDIVTRHMSKEKNRARVAKFRKNVGGQSNWNAIRAEILAGHPECSYCHKAVATEVDHIVPLSKGGTNERSNLTPSCRSCNTKKSTGLVMPCNGLYANVIQSDTDTEAEEPPTPLQGVIDEAHAVLERADTELIAADDTMKRAAAFLDQYPSVYARSRSGARYTVKEARDFPTALELVTAYPDPAHLESMLRLFLLKKDFAPKNQPGSPRQFAWMAPQCDALLREARKP